MIKGIGFETVIASPSEYEYLVAEIYFDGLIVALVSQERGLGLFDLETPGPLVAEMEVIRKTDFERIQECH